MSIKKAFLISVFCLVLLSHLSLLSTPDFPWTHRLSLMFGLILSFWYQLSQVRLPRWFFNLLALIALSLSLIYGIWLAQDFILAGVYFLAYIIALRMFELETQRDFSLAILLSFLELAGASILTVQLRYLLWVLLYLPLAIFSLILFNLYIELERTDEKKLKKELLKEGGKLFLIAQSAGFTTIIIGFMFFFLLPRISVGLLMLPLSSGRMWSGYADSVRLGDIGTIMEDKTPVMRVKLLNQDKEIEDIKWRMLAMEHYSNGMWEDKLGIKEVLRLYYKRSSLVSVVPREGKELIQEIFLEPIESPYLPSAGRVYAYSLPYPRYTQMLSFQNDYYGVSGSISEPLHYFAYSKMPAFRLQGISKDELGSNEIKIMKEKGYLDLPPDSQKLCELAKKVTEDTSNINEILSRLKTYFQDNYRYTQSLKAVEGDPVNYFLFNSREGNCEYFASSAVLMLRCLGIPSRLVVGFISGEWNPYENYYLVRQSDAHSWVELYIANLGWQEFDPTPAGLRLQEHRSSKFFQFIDSIGYRWNRWVVEYSIDDQLRAFRKFRSRGLRISSAPRMNFIQFKLSLRAHPERIAIFILLIFGIYFLSLIISRRLSPEGKLLKGLSEQAKEYALLYLKLVSILKQKGISKPPSMTAIELINWLKAMGPEELVKRSAEIVEHYYGARFGGKEFPKERARELRANLKALRRIRASGGTFQST